MTRRKHTYITLAAWLLVACGSSPALSLVLVPQLRGTCGVAVGSEGNLYIADYAGHRIMKVEPAGKVTTLAGTGRAGYSGDGGPAAKATLSGPCGVAVGPGGDFYIADRENDRVRKINRAGVITTVAGNGERGYSGDGGPATEARLSAPMDVAPGPDGSLYIVDAGNDRIRKVDPEGIITTAAGSGREGYSGDGGPAVAADLNYPRGMAVGADGTLYIADSYNHRVRKVDPDGVITTVAGEGEEGYSGDGGPATKAKLKSPGSVALGTDGSLYIADVQDHRIRKIGPDGVVTTVAGNGKQGCSGDGGPAVSARLDQPCAVAMGADGSLYIADYANRRIRKVDGAGVITTAAIDSAYKAPDFTVYTSDGETVRLSDLAGSPVVVHFWGTWCMPCRKETPIVDKMYQTYQPKGIRFVAIAVGDTEQKVAEYLKKQGLHWPSGLDFKQAILAKYGAEAVPSTFLIDGNGMITRVQVGMADEKTWVDMMEGLLPG